MKNILFFIAFILMVSCSNNNSFDEKETVIQVNSIKKYSTNSLVKEKFLEFYDLKLLLKNKPEFKEIIEKRLADFKIDSNSVLEIDKDSKIKNLEITAPNSININSYTKLKVSFEIENKTTLKKDSLIAVIFEEEIILENNKVIATKVKFSRFE